LTAGRLKSNLYLIHTDYFLIGMFLILSSVSYIFSNYRSEALIGAGSRYTGYAFMVGLCLLYFVVRRCYKYVRFDFNIILISVVIINLIAVLNFCGMDPLGFFVGMKDSSKDSFISILGNIDIFAAYTCIFSPIAMVLFIKCESIRYTIFYGCVSYIAVMGMFVSNSDCAFIGLFVFLIIVLYLCFDEINDLRRYLCLLIIIGFSDLTLVRIIHVRLETARKFYSILGNFVELKIAIILIIIALILCLILNKCKSYFRVHAFETHKVSVSECLKKIYRYTVLSGVAIFLLLFIYFSIINKTIEIGALSNYLRFDDSWGSGRGFIWVSAIEVYNKTPLFHRIVGTGEATFRITIASITSQYNSLYFGKIVDSAHNEFIHYMITIGVFGGLNYLLIIIFTLKKIFYKNKKFVIKYAVGVGILCYVVQSSFNIIQPITTPILFTLLAIFNQSDARY